LSSSSKIFGAEYEKTIDYNRVRSSEAFEVIAADGRIIGGDHRDKTLGNNQLKLIASHKEGEFFSERFFEEKALNTTRVLADGNILLSYIPNSELYWYRNAQAYETGLADVLLFTIIYVVIALLVHQIVVRNIEIINDSLDRITNGDLNEVVKVRNSSEFASLSDDINHTVDALKGYIEAAEKRIEQEIIFARNIQESALPRNFVFPERNEFEIYASMNAAKEVGGDFYDFFFVGKNKMALVIADVSGKGIPAALFMMRSKTAIRSLAESGGTPAEIIFKANNALCEGNDADMFVTVWLGIIDLETGVMECANAGHEYPILKKAGGAFEIIKDKHSLALAAMEGIKAKEYELQLSPGDKLFVYTDGVPEAINEAEEQYGTDRLERALNEVGDAKVSEILPHIYKSVESFKGEADQFDDITMLGFEFKEYMKA
ncbi:MAG: SpoIIE family protein phosphatase, partial [Firmicutes bacterium]|nr:SpoIIE family protein phosphatase [Bacillota bacterium]